MGALRLLLDTHAFVWALTDSGELKGSARKLISAAEKRFVSAASYWEIATKARLGKWPGVEKCLLSRQKLLGLGFTPLALDLKSAARAGAFEWDHRDPFDRMLVAQAETKSVPLLSYDAALKTQSWARIVQ